MSPTSLCRSMLQCLRCFSINHRFIGHFFFLGFLSGLQLFRSFLSAYTFPIKPSQLVCWYLFFVLHSFQGFPHFSCFFTPVYLCHCPCVCVCVLLRSLILFQHFQPTTPLFNPFFLSFIYRMYHHPSTTPVVRSVSVSSPLSPFLTPCSISYRFSFPHLKIKGLAVYVLKNITFIPS